MSRCLILLILPALVHGNTSQQYISTTHVSGHASLVEPPSRAAMHLYGFPQNPVSHFHLIFTKITCHLYPDLFAIGPEGFQGFLEFLPDNQARKQECYIRDTLTLCENSAKCTY